MADQQIREAPQPIREGSRWRHAAPTAEMVTSWFEEQPLHQGMEHQRERYIGGIVVIGATEKVKLTKWKQNGDPYVIEVEEAVFTPYVKVDTRIAYFRDYVRVLNGGQPVGDYVGVIEPVEVPRITDTGSGYYNAHLKTGLSFHAVRHQQGDQISKYLISTWRVAIYERQSYAERLKGNVAIPVLQGEGSKQVPVQKRFPDDSAVMKAETGAIGRALGVAGILVVGTGVASAEDIQEALSATPQTGGAPDVPVAAELPPASPVRATADATAGEAPVPAEQVGEQDENVALRAQAIQLRHQLQALSAQGWNNYVAWYNERGFAPLSELEGSALKGAVRKLERDVADALPPSAQGASDGAEG